MQGFVTHLVNRQILVIYDVFLFFDLVGLINKIGNPLVFQSCFRVSSKSTLLFNGIRKSSISSHVYSPLLFPILFSLLTTYIWLTKFMVLVCTFFTVRKVSGRQSQTHIIVSPQLIYSTPRTNSAIIKYFSSLVCHLNNYKDKVSNSICLCMICNSSSVGLLLKSPGYFTHLSTIACIASTSTQSLLKFNLNKSCLQLPVSLLLQQ